MTEDREDRLAMPMDDYAHIPQGGPHIVCGRLDDGRHCAVAVLKNDEHVTVITVGTGKSRKSAIADCRNDLEAAMKAYVAERLEDELGWDVISVEKLRDH